MSSSISKLFFSLAIISLYYSCTNNSELTQNYSTTTSSNYDLYLDALDVDQSRSKNNSKFSAISEDSISNILGNQILFEIPIGEENPIESSIQTLPDKFCIFNNTKRVSCRFRISDQAHFPYYS